MNLYYVNPTDTTDITRLRTPFSGGLPDGRVVSGLVNPVPEWDVYGEDDQRTLPPDAYRDSREVWTFVGVVKDPAAVVRVTSDHQQIPIADLYERKRQEIANQDRVVRYNAVDTSLSVNWWLIVTEDARSELVTVATGSNSRAIAGQPWPTGSNAPWLGIYNAATEDARRHKITDQADWDTLETEWYQHDQATGNATHASRTALDAAYDAGAGDWQAVANHDPAAPAWGYPPTVDPGGLNAAIT